MLALVVAICSTFDDVPESEAGVLFVMGPVTAEIG